MNANICDFNRLSVTFILAILFLGRQKIMKAAVLDLLLRKSE
jgi:hypothetical protein